MVKDPTKSFTHRGHTAIDTHGIQALTDRTVDLQHLEHRSDVPDMPESNVCELATPLRSYATSATQRHQFVAKALAALETGARQLPNTVDTVRPVRFTDDVIEKQRLQKVKFCC